MVLKFQPLSYEGGCIVGSHRKAKQPITTP